MLVVSLKIHFPEISSSITTLYCATLSSTCPGPIFKPLGVLSPLSPVQPHAIQTTTPWQIRKQAQRGCADCPRQHRE